MKKQLLTEQSKTNECIDFISDILKEYGIDDKQRIKTMLLAEETLVKLREHTTDIDEKICVSVNKTISSITVRLSLRGEEFQLIYGHTVEEILDQENDDLQRAEDKEEKIIRDVLLKSNEEALRYKNKHQVNTIEITVKKNPHAMIMNTMIALGTAIVLGFIMRLFVPEMITTVIRENVLDSVNKMFLNALKMVVSPVVFFSILCCISQFGDLKEVGRIGGKILGVYLSTSIIAIFVAAGTFMVLKPGNAELAKKLTTDTSAITSAEMSVSIKDTIVDIVPANFVKPFLESNMIQLIFMAVVVGFALKKIGEHTKLLKEIFDGCNALFMKITVMLVQFIPIATFTSVLSLVLKTGADVLVSMLAMLGTFLVGLLVMMIVYCLLILLVGHLNPLIFLKKYVPTMLQVFGMGSSIPAIVVNMEACDRKLGIPKKIYALSIPLGATINMDGTCVYLIVFSMALARIFGVDISGGMLVSLFLSVLILSVGAPGVPGSGMICLSVILTQLNIPVAGIGLVMGLDSLLGMIRAVGNSTADVVGSLLVAKIEKILDMETYMKK